MLHEALEAPSVPLEDIEEVSTYINAIHHGIARLQKDDFPLSLRLIREVHEKLLHNTARLQKDDFPLSLRLIREVHEKLLHNTRGMHKQAGHFRQSQNWIGGSRPSNALFVPPPPEKLADLLKNLEAFIHEEQSNLPHLVKVAMLHLQFETIHPFLDGNGRAGRLLITLYLLDSGMLDAPMLYLSLYFKTHHFTYYRLLHDARHSEDGMLAWIRFFLQGVIETSDSVKQQTTQIRNLTSTDRRRVAYRSSRPKVMEALYDVLVFHPIITIPFASKKTGLSQPTMTKAIQDMEALEVLIEITGKRRGKVYLYPLLYVLDDLKL
jgi:Fic family protein